MQIVLGRIPGGPLIGGALFGDGGGMVGVGKLVPGQKPKTPFLLNLL